MPPRTVARTPFRRLSRALSLSLLLLSGPLFHASILFASSDSAPGIDALEQASHNNQNTLHTMDVEIVGNRAYVASGFSDGIETYDISDPNQMTRVSALGPATWRLRAYGNRLYAFCHEFGLRILDITGSTVDIGRYYPQASDIYYEGGALVGSRMYVAAHQHGIQIVNVADPGNVRFESAFSLGNDAAWAVEEGGGNLFVANGRHGLTIVNIGSAPAVTATLALPGLANDVLLDDSGTVAIVALGAAGLATVDVSDPDHPVLLDIAETAGACFGMGRLHDRVVVGSATRVELFDVSDPAAIELAAFEDAPTWSMGADIQDDGLGGIVVAADWIGINAYRVRPDAAADIEIHPTRIDFGGVSAVADTTVAVLNRGTSDLQGSIEAPPGFIVDPPSFILGPGERLDLTVSASGTATGDSFVQISSNDPDESEIRLFVYKNNTAFPQIGSMAPDFTLMGTDGQLHTLSDLRGQVVYLDFGSFL